MDEESLERREEFREQLTLGLVSALETIPYVKDVVHAESPPCDNIAITSWEQRYSTVLPHEIKDFYLATDGFKLTWSFSHAGQLLPIGLMTINRISDLRRVAGLRHRFDTEQPTLLDLEVVNNRDKSSRLAHAPPSMVAPPGAAGVFSGGGAATSTPPSSSSSALQSSSSSSSTSSVQHGATPLIKPQFGLRWKMFELDNCSGNGRVCLVFPPKPDPPPVDDSGLIQLDVVPPTPQVWYLDRAYDWHFLAPTFTHYFRMMLVHLGLPEWQAIFTPFGPTPWSKYVINLIAPHLVSTDGPPAGTTGLSLFSNEQFGADDEDDVANGVDGRDAATNGMCRPEEFPLVTLDPSVFKARKSSRKNEDN